MRRDVAAGDRSAAVARFMAFVGAPEELVDGMRQSPAWPVFESVAPTLVTDAEALEAADGAPVPAGRLAALTVPVLVLDGGDSTELLRDAARATAAAAHAEYRTLDGQTHEVAPEVLAPVLAEFVAKG